MNIDNIYENIKYTDNIGFTLSDEDILKLKIESKLLKESQNHDSIEFFGVINGIESNYYIIIGINYKHFKNIFNRKFYWAKEDLKFCPLLEITDKDKKILAKYNSYLTGNHKNIINVDHKYTELDKLSQLVQDMNDFILVPNSAYEILPNNELKINKNYNGIKNSNLDNFLRLKEGDEQYIIRNKCLNKNDEYNLSNYLLKLENKNKRLFSIIESFDKNSIYIRSMLYQGLVMYTSKNCSIFGYYYFGDGIKQNDLAFVLNN